MDERRVLLLGNSLLLWGVAASLKGGAPVHVACARSWAEAGPLLAQRIPDVLVFDLALAGESALLPLLCEHAGMTLVGLDTERNRAVLLTGTEASAMTIERLRAIIQAPATE